MAASRPSTTPSARNKKALTERQLAADAFFDTVYKEMGRRVLSATQKQWPRRKQATFDTLGRWESGAEPRHKIHWEELRYEMNPCPGEKFWLDTRRTTTEVSRHKESYRLQRTHRAAELLTNPLHSWENGRRKASEFKRAQSQGFLNLERRPLLSERQSSGLEDVLIHPYPGGLGFPSERSTRSLCEL